MKRNRLENQTGVFKVKNANGDPNTTAEVVVRNQIDYTPKVSVIIPVYNVEDYLRECLDSIIQQTLREIEIICVDDGSTDSSFSILKEYADRDNRITLVRQNNLHAGVARNAGIMLAKGEYLSFLDADDFFDLKMLEECYSRLKEDSSDVCIFSALMIDYSVMQNRDMPWMCPKEDTVLDIATLKGDICNITSPNCWNKIFSREIIDKHHIRFQNIVNANDVYFSYMASMMASKISVIAKKFVNYRYNTGKQITAKLSQVSPLNIYRALSQLKKEVTKVKGKSFITDGFYEKIIPLLRYERRKNFIAFELNKKTYRKLFPSDKLSLFDSAFQPAAIVFASDDNYAKYLSVTITSIQKNLPKGLSCRFFIMQDRLSQHIRKRLLELSTPRTPIEFIDVSPYLANHHLYECAYFTRETYYRFFIPQIFKNEEKVLYMDCDMIVCDNVLELFQIDLGQNVIATARDCITEAKKNNILSYLKIDPQNYFNAGLAVFNIGPWNRLGLTKKCLELVPKYTRLWTPDQDILNMVCSGRVTILPREWNLLWHPAFFNKEKYGEIDGEIRKEYEEVYERPKLIHYTSSVKPWQYKSGKHSAAFWKYARMSPFYNDIKKEYHEVIISLTSYPARINTVHLTIESLLRQSWRAEKVVLWLAPEQFPNREKDLPSQLLELTSRGLTIDWYHDIRSYKKLIPALRKYPDSVIVTADDDAIYPSNWLVELVNAYKKNKNAIHCHRCRRVNREGKVINPYNTWGFIVKEDSCSYDNFFTGLGGVLYPPHSLHPKVMDERSFMTLVPDGDDIWFWGMALLKHTPINVFKKQISQFDNIPNTQDTALWNTNCKGEFNNDCKIQNLFRHYPKILEILVKGIEHDYNPIKPYISFLRLPALKRRNTGRLSNRVVERLAIMRIDAKNVGSPHHALSIKSNKAVITQPKWLENSRGKGNCVESSQSKETLQIKAIKSGKLILNFRGCDRRYNGKRFPLWVDYESIKINGKELLPKPIAVWHDEPFCYEMPVRDGQIVTVVIEQKYHPYNFEELTNTVKMLRLGSEYEDNRVIKQAYRKISHKGIGYFIFHKKVTDQYREYYLFCIRIRKKEANLYNYPDRRHEDLGNGMGRHTACDSRVVRGFRGSIKAYLFFPYYFCKLLQIKKKTNI